ncbi:putative UDP-rhamnose:rhamnosyltransferase 1 [Cryptomeria japonica]|uniref:putative UDP-rhamnose:rhamnosyltransferase 1 n=1 Tax=Cryptomeria japonica TaxID=3369 RepID=UPI0027D9DA1E|nr:putative UDP-rhamnose:rhamnosyltransferase 1 [Cryptomeria japonica]
MADDRQLHVVMFPWFAQGHITPFLELAKSLLTSGLRISFVSTLVNIARTKKKIVLGIEPVELQLPSMDGLPTCVECMTGLSEIRRTDLVQLLFQAIDICEQPFGALMKLLSPDFVIFDAALCWTPRVANKMAIPTINFMVVCMAATSFKIGKHRQRLPEILMVEDLTVPLHGLPSSVVCFQPFEAQKESKGLTFMNRLSISMEESWATLSNTCRELEGKFVDYFQRSTEQFMFPMGISMTSLWPQPDADSCLAWLDRLPTHSVVFACFSSECPLSVQDLDALLLGLEESEISFLCVLFGHVGYELHRVSEDHTHGRGLVVTEWAPQLHI